MQEKTFVHMRILKSNLFCGAQEVVTYSIAYPQFSAYTQKSYLKTLNEQYRQEEVPFFPYEMLRTVMPAQLSDGIISLYYDTYRFTGGAHGTTLRQADTWDISKQAAIHLRDLFPCDSLAKDRIIEQVNACIAKEAESYFPDYEALVRENFNARQFFLSPGCLHIFYQQYDIAPYSTGIPTFGLKMESLQKV